MREHLDGPYLPAVGPRRGALGGGPWHAQLLWRISFRESGRRVDFAGRISWAAILSLSAACFTRSAATPIARCCLARFRRGEWVGEVDLFDPVSAMCSVIVIEQTQYWTIARSDLEEFINNYPQGWHSTGHQPGLAAQPALEIRDEAAHGGSGTGRRARLAPGGVLDLAPGARPSPPCRVLGNPPDLLAPARSKQRRASETIP